MPAFEFFRRRPFVGALCVGLVVLAAYTATLAPDVPPTDSGELILAAWLPGVAHAPGFPLWVVLGWFFSHALPFGDVVTRLNWMSAWWGACAVVATYACLLLALRFSPPSHATTRRAHAKTRGQNSPPTLISDPQILIVAAVVAVSFGFSRTLWAWSVVAEVYSLHVFLAATILALLLRWRQDVQRADAPALAGRWLVLAAFVYGLALGNHNLTIGLLAPAILFLLVANRRGLTGRLVVFCALALGAGALIYLYLPLRAAQNPLLNWGDPHDLQRLWWHVTGKQYQVNIGSGTLASMAQELGAGISLWLQQFTPLGAILCVVGAVNLWRRDRFLAIFSALIVFLGVGYAVLYQIADDRDAYYLSTFLVSALWLAFGVRAAWTWLASRFSWLQSKRWLVLFALILLPVITFVWNFSVANHRDNVYSGTYARNALTEVAPDALILTGDWQLYAPLLTLQHVLGARPDVTTLDVLLFQNRPWYFQQIQQKAPALLAAVQPETNAFLEKLRAFEADQLSAGDAEIGPRYETLWRSLLADAWKKRPVYATADAVAHLREFNIDLSKQLVPNGVLFRVLPTSPSTLPALPALMWNVQPFVDAGTRYLNEPARKVARAHATMAMNRGAYAAQLGEPDTALRAYELAVAIDSTNVDAYVVFADALAKQGNLPEARRALQTALALEPENVQIQQRLAALP